MRVEDINMNGNVKKSYPIKRSGDNKRARPDDSDRYNNANFLKK